jgi:acyl-CoA thioesterase
MSEGKKDASDAVAELRVRGEKEPIASFLKMNLLELTPGYAKVAMSLTPEHQNFIGLISGSMVMAIADHAFAYASNSVAYPSAASQLNIHFVAGASIDDELTAECRVVRSGRRVGISEITVTDQAGKLIAKATGTTIPIAEAGLDGKES